MQASAVFSLKYPPTSSHSPAVRRELRGSDFVEHLQSLGLLHKAATVECDLVAGWMKNPATYPEELKGKTVLLLNSEPAEGAGYVTTLEWYDGRVILSAFWLHHLMDSSMPALLLRE